MFSCTAPAVFSVCICSPVLCDIFCCIFATNFVINAFTFSKAGSGTFAVSIFSISSIDWIAFLTIGEGAGGYGGIGAGAGAGTCSLFKTVLNS